MRSQILLVDDDAVTVEHARSALERSGRAVDIARDGAAAFAMAQSKAYSAIVLDRMLPKLRGLEVLRRLRENGIATPVLFLSGLSSVAERIRGLQEGADDYLIKPFEVSELVARVQVLERRGAPPQNGEAVLTYGNIRLDPAARRAVGGLSALPLSGKEFDVLRCLVEHQGNPVARTVLLKEIWNFSFDPGTNVVDVHVSRLRGKLEAIGASASIRSIRGVGYALQELSA